MIVPYAKRSGTEDLSVTCEHLFEWLPLCTRYVVACLCVAVALLYLVGSIVLGMRLYVWLKNRKFAASSIFTRNRDARKTRLGNIVHFSHVPHTPPRRSLLGTSELGVFQKEPQLEPYLLDRRSYEQSPSPTKKPTSPTSPTPASATSPTSHSSNTSQDSYDFAIVDLGGPPSIATPPGRPLGRPTSPTLSTRSNYSQGSSYATTSLASRSYPSRAVALARALRQGDTESENPRNVFDRVSEEGGSSTATSPTESSVHTIRRPVMVEHRASCVTPPPPAYSQFTLSKTRGIGMKVRFDSVHKPKN